MAKKHDTHSSTKHGIRSPMSGYQQNESHRTPGFGTTEVIRGSAPKKAAHISSPNKSKATGN